MRPSGSEKGGRKRTTSNSGDALAIYSIEEVTGSSPVAPTLHRQCTATLPRKGERATLDVALGKVYPLDQPFGEPDAWKRARPVREEEIGNGFPRGIPRRSPTSSKRPLVRNQ